MPTSCRTTGPPVRGATPWFMPRPRGSPPRAGPRWYGPAFHSCAWPISKNTACVQQVGAYAGFIGDTRSSPRTEVAAGLARYGKANCDFHTLTFMPLVGWAEQRLSVFVCFGFFAVSERNPLMNSPPCSSRLTRLAASVWTTSLFVLLSSLMQSRSVAIAGTLQMLYVPESAATTAIGISSDGAVVAGNADSQFWRWTSAGGFQVVGPGSAAAISGDGGTIVGSYSVAPYTRAFRWKSSGEFDDLGVLTPNASASYAAGVSQFGTVVVGRSDTYVGTRAFVWTAEDGMHGVDQSPPWLGNLSYATGIGVSPNATIVVGTGGNSMQPFRWTSTGQTEIIRSSGEASGVSADGGVVLGTDSSVRWAWSAETGAVNLPTWSGTGSIKALAVAGGDVIVGDGQLSDVSSLEKSAAYAYLSARGFDVTGWSDMNATGVSADGNTLVGYGAYDGSTRGFIASVPEPATYAMALVGIACGGFSMRRRKRVGRTRSPIVAASLAMAAAWLCTKPTHAVTIDLVTVGNPGNASDTTGYGAVNYEYKIGKYEVTIGQYAEFLNAAAKSDPYGLWDSSMQTDLMVAGISRSGASGAYEYTVMSVSGIAPYGGVSNANRPIAYITWWDAARFANWMQNGQGSGSTETGAYTFVGGQTSGTPPERNPGAQFFVPTENEWYKAAYYSPLLNSGTGGYWSYATQSNSTPGNAIGGGSNQANGYVGGYAVTQSSGYSTSQNYLTDVGAFTSSSSYYGTFDQSGNVQEWNETGVPGGYRGGFWGDYAVNLSSSIRNSNYPLMGLGFRLAAVPEPSTYAMALAGLACGGYSMWRRRKRA